jgi:hypothetical protein
MLRVTSSPFLSTAASRLRTPLYLASCGLISFTGPKIRSQNKEKEGLVKLWRYINFLKENPLMESYTFILENMEFELTANGVKVIKADH